MSTGVWTFYTFFILPNFDWQQTRGYICCYYVFSQFDCNGYSIMHFIYDFRLNNAKMYMNKVAIRMVKNMKKYIMVWFLSFLGGKMFKI